MTYYINRAEARAKARQDLTILREINAIMEAILIDAGNGSYQTTVDDGTSMTNSTPDVVVIGTISNPTITGTPTLIINNISFELGISGLNLNSIIADINDANVTGLAASKNTDNQLVLTYTTTQQNWDLTIGQGTANNDLGLLGDVTVTADDTDSVNFFRTWDGITADRTKTDQMQQVIKYFENLGYAIDQQTNSSTNKTFKWIVSY